MPQFRPRPQQVASLAGSSAPKSLIARVPEPTVSISTSTFHISTSISIPYLSLYPFYLHPYLYLYLSCLKELFNSLMRLLAKMQFMLEGYEESRRLSESEAATSRQAQMLYGPFKQET